MHELVRYDGSADRPYPPVGPGWSEVTADSGALFERARAEASTLGELPACHYTDRMTDCGCFRFFAFDSPVGAQMAALYYDGTIGQDPNAPGWSGQGTSDKISTDTQGTLADGSGDTYSTQGGSSEPIPQPDANCSQWVPDATNASATAIATSISYHGTPVPFVDQGVYNTTISGTSWRFVMWAGDCVGDGGTYNCVSAFRCVPATPPPPPPPPPPGPTPTPTPTPQQASSSSGGIIAVIIGAIVVVGGLVAAGTGKLS